MAAASGCLAGWWWSLPFWLVAAVRPAVLPRSAARGAGRPAARWSSPADGRIVAVEKARDPYLERDALKISVFMNVFNVHSNRSPVDGEVKQRWYHAGHVPQRRARQGVRSRTSATRCGCGRATRRRRHLRAGRRADRAPHPLLRQAPATELAARAALRLHPLRLARGRVPAARTREPKAALGDKVYAAEQRAGEAARPWLSDEISMPDTSREEPPLRRRAAPARHLPAAQPVHHGGAVRRLLRHRAGDEQPLRAGGDRHLRRHGARRPGRPRRAPDAHAERVRRRVRQPLRHGVASAPRPRW